MIASSFEVIDIDEVKRALEQSKTRGRWTKKGIIARQVVFCVKQLPICSDPKINRGHFPALKSKSLQLLFTS